MFGADGEVVRVPVRPRVRRSREDDPARARFIDLLVRDPTAAWRERLEDRRAYWTRHIDRARRDGDLRAMLEAEARLRELDAALAR
jgi:ATP-dependent DNA ligase